MIKVSSGGRLQRIQHAWGPVWTFQSVMFRWVIKFKISTAVHQELYLLPDLSLTCLITVLSARMLFHNLDFTKHQKKKHCGLLFSFSKVGSVSELEEWGATVSAAPAAADVTTGGNIRGCDIVWSILFPTLQTENMALWSSTNSEISQDLNCSDIHRPSNEMIQATRDSHKFTPYWLWHIYIFAQSGSTLSWLLLVTFSKARETFILHTQSNVKWL